MTSEQPGRDQRQPPGSYLRLIDSGITQLRLKDLLGPVTRVKKTKKKSGSVTDRPQPHIALSRKVRPKPRSKCRFIRYICTEEFLISPAKINGPICEARCVESHQITLLYRGTSLIRNRTPPRTARGPYAYAYCRVLGGGVSYKRGTPVPTSDLPPCGLFAFRVSGFGLPSSGPLKTDSEHYFTEM